MSYIFNATDMVSNYKIGFIAFFFLHLGFSEFIYGLLALNKNIFIIVILYLAVNFNILSQSFLFSIPIFPTLATLSFLIPTFVMKAIIKM